MIGASLGARKSSRALKDEPSANSFSSLYLPSPARPRSARCTRVVARDRYLCRNPSEGSQSGQHRSGQPPVRPAFGGPESKVVSPRGNHKRLEAIAHCGRDQHGLVWDPERMHHVRPKVVESSSARHGLLSHGRTSRPGDASRDGRGPEQIDFRCVLGAHRHLRPATPRSATDLRELADRHRWVSGGQPRREASAERQDCPAP